MAHMNSPRTLKKSSLFLSLSIRSLARSWKKWRSRSTEDKKLPQWESDYILNTEPDFRMFYEYLEMGKFRDTELKMW